MAAAVILFEAARQRRAGELEGVSKMVEAMVERGNRFRFAHK